MAQSRHIRIFLSSPGDVSDERSIALQVIDQLTYDPILRGKVTFEVVAWDKPGAGTPMLATMTPQDAINAGLPKPSQCDIVVVIFWTRMGTPLPHPEFKKDDGSPYFSGTEWEYADAMNAARQFKRPEVVIYRRTEDPIINLKDPQRTERIQQWERVETFFTHFSDPKTGAIRQGYNNYKTTEDFRRKFEDHLKILVNRLLDSSSEISSVPQYSHASVWGNSPFPGLRAFTPEDAPIFFGRGSETDALVKRVEVNRFIAIISASGSGKSSLVGAGLIPRLKGNAIEGSKDWLLPEWKDGLWTGLRFTPGELGDNPFSALSVKLAPMIGETPRKITQLLEKSPDDFAQLGQKVLLQKPRWAEILVFIDQFEELFTLVSERHRFPFINMLAQSLSTTSIRIVITMRADFYNDCLKIKLLEELLRDGSFPLGAPDTFALLEMIERPAERAGLIFDDGLARRIVRDTGNEPGSLALMAYALDELYKMRDKDGRLTGNVYRQLGGVEGAIGTRAQALFDELSPDAQTALPDVFRRLVAVNLDGVPTRRRAHPDDVAQTDGAKQLISALADPHIRLVVQDKGSDNQPVIEVAHEALFRSWPILATWIEETKNDLYLEEQLKLAAREWDINSRNPAYLWSGERLKRAQDLVNRLNLKPDNVVEDFISPKAELVALLGEIEDIEKDHNRRNEIGLRLNAIGDSRKGVGLRANGLPDLAWSSLISGEFVIDDQIPIPIFPLYMAQFPVTFQQYQSFLNSQDGFSNNAWWERLVRPNPVRQRYLFNNHPRENVNWYEAIAFCRWLTAKLPNADWPGGERDGRCIRLPTEWEWQFAATGANVDHIYPWGKEANANLANTAESGIGHTTAVGMYPRGASLSNIYDMTGNVWEWCFLTNQNQLVKEERLQALRGGAFNHYINCSSASYRNVLKPDERDSNIGFRVCVAQPIGK